MLSAIYIYFKNDPLIELIKEQPEFRQILEEIETKFWKNHQQIKTSLVEKGLL